MMQIKGAGGSSGGIGRFFIGLVMMIAGGYLFLNAIQVTNQFSMGYGIYSFGALRITPGLLLVPLIFGIGIIFYNARNLLGWFLCLATLTMLFFGIISALNFRLQRMTAFELLTIIILLIGGIGLFLSSLRSFDSD